MTTLLLAEHDHATLKDATNKALTAATQLGGEVHVLVAGGGDGTRTAAEAAAKLAGVKKVLLADDAAYAHDLAEPLAVAGNRRFRRRRDGLPRNDGGHFSRQGGRGVAEEDRRPRCSKIEHGVDRRRHRDAEFGGGRTLALDRRRRERNGRFDR